jgi:hypothetical protein
MAKGLKSERGEFEDISGVEQCDSIVGSIETPLHRRRKQSSILVCTKVRNIVKLINH